MGPNLATSSIAILPFTNMSGDPEQEYFSDGITEDIITDLSKIAGLTVIARNSSFTYKGRAVDVRAVGRELGVSSVLEGSIRRAGNRVRITAQLIDATSGGHLWADRYDRDLTDIFEVQDDVTHRIVEALKVTLSPAEKAQLNDSGTSNIEAYDCALRGREVLLGNPKSRSTFEQSKAFFIRAIEIDPKYAQAYAGLGFAYMFDYQNRWSDDPDGSLPLAKHYAEQAIEKNPKEPLARIVAAVAATFDRDLDRAKSEVDAALALNPNLAMAYNVLGGICSYSGQPLEAIPMIERAMRLDPAASHQYLHSWAWPIFLPANTKRRQPCSGSVFSWCPKRIFLALPSPPLSVISARLKRRVGSGASSKRSIQITHSASISAGCRSKEKKMCSGSPKASRKPDC